MRKLFFTLALASLAGAASAQSVSLDKVNKSMVPQLPTLNQRMAFAKEGVKTPKKTISNGVYYQPQGGLWRGFDLFSGLGYYRTAYSMPSLTDVTFKNMCTGTPSWTINGNDASSSVDENGNLVEMFSPCRAFYAPVVAVGKTTWSYGDNNLYTLRGVGDYSTPMVVTDSVTTLCLVSPVAAYEYNGTYYSNQQNWGAMDNDYMYGSGTYTDETTYKGTAAEQVFPALASPLYVEQIAVDGSSLTQPIADGKTLTVYVTDVKEQTASDGSVRKVAGDNILQTLTASATDTLDFKYSYAINNKTRKFGTVLFSKKVVDDFGGESIEPFVIPAGQEYAIVVSGLDQDGIDFGIEGRSTEDEYDVEVGRQVITDGNEYFRFGYQNCALNVSLYGMFEKMFVATSGMMNDEPENIEYNKIRVSADGTTMTYEGTDYDATSGVPVYTATAFFDGDGLSNYDIDLPDWIHCSVYTDYYGNAGFNLLIFTVDALPAGVTGRNAVLTLSGRGGIEADKNICIAQGDAVLAVDGVNVEEKKSSDSRMFNLAGQQVSKNYKGIVVKGGKKFMNK